MNKYSRNDPIPPSRDDSLLTYGRPSTSAWIAAAAVAIAFFLLGGFIKTYRQLEAVREDARLESAELRETIRRLRDELAPGRYAAKPAQYVERQFPERQYAQPRIQPLPPSRRNSYPVDAPPLPDVGYSQFTQTRPQPEPQMPPQTPAAAQARGGSETLYRNEFPQVDPGGGGYAHGVEERLANAKGQTCQVVSVSRDKKRLLIEGGRDVGMERGMGLEFSRNGRSMGEVKVIEVYGNQSVGEVVRAAVVPQPGDTVRRL